MDILYPPHIATTADGYIHYTTLLILEIYDSRIGYKLKKCAVDHAHHF